MQIDIFNHLRPHFTCTSRNRNNYICTPHQASGQKITVDFDDISNVILILVAAISSDWDPGKFQSLSKRQQANHVNKVLHAFVTPPL